MTETQDRVDESSPLVGPDDDNEEEVLVPHAHDERRHEDGLSGTETGTDMETETKSSLYLFLLTLSIGG